MRTYLSLASLGLVLSTACTADEPGQQSAELLPVDPGPAIDTLVSQGTAGSQAGAEGIDVDASDHSFVVAGYAGAGSRHPLVARFDASGALLWSHHRAAEVGELRDVVLLGDGTIVVVGERDRSGAIRREGFVAAYDPDGVSLWELSVGIKPQMSGGTATSVIATADGGL
jgi:hypothetical protein